MCEPRGVLVATLAELETLVDEVAWWPLGVVRLDGLVEDRTQDFVSLCRLQGGDHADHKS